MARPGERAAIRPVIRWTAWVALASVLWTGSLGLAQPIPEPGRLPAHLEPSSRTFTFAGRSFPAMQALSAPIDPARYRIGPGDGLQIQIWGGVDLLHEVIVTAESKIVVPTLGTLDVKGKTLKETQELIAREALRYYRGASVAATLAVLRVYEVFVLGEVKQPGIYPATPVTRVTELLGQAGGVAASGSLRRIELRRDGLTAFADVSRFLYDGILEENPYVPDGAAIFVPLNTGTALVEGAVQRPGTYTLREDDTLETLIAAAGGLKPEADPGRISRRAEDGDEAAPLDFAADDVRQTAIQDGDRIAVPSKDGRVAPIPIIEDQVYVVGNVKEPGPYPYVRNRSVLDYIGLAGGGDDRAKLSRTVVHRRQQELDARRVTSVQPGDMIVVPEKRLKWWQDYVAIITAVSSVVLSAIAVSLAARNNN
ncbi:MAG: SLBB domain-containing protein [Nitrospirota bacterium]